MGRWLARLNFNILVQRWEIYLILIYLCIHNDSFVSHLSFTLEELLGFLLLTNILFYFSLLKLSPPLIVNFFFLMIYVPCTSPHHPRGAIMHSRLSIFVQYVQIYWHPMAHDLCWQDPKYMHISYCKKFKLIYENLI